MARPSDRGSPVTLVCAEDAELVVRLPAGSVLFVPGDCAFEVRSGCVREAERAPEGSTSRAHAGNPHDLRVQKALAAMQAQPGRRWTVAQLARLVGASRSVFAKLFVLEMSETAGAWLARQRLALARQLVESTDAKLAEIAGRVGYASEFALSRAFRRHYGIAPGRFRKASWTHQHETRCAA